MPEKENQTVQKKGNKSVGIVKIAEELGISKTTVGYVLSGQAKKRRVSDKTAQEILETAKRLNYIPHLWAKNLARQRTGVVGMVIGGFEYNWAADIYDGILPVLEEKGYLPMTSVHMWNPERNERELRINMGRRDEGIICQPLPKSLKAYQNIRKAGIPLLFICDTLQEMPDANYVAWDCAPAAKIAVRHLIQTGRKRIGFLGSTLIQTQLVIARCRAYQDTLIEAGLTVDQSFVKWFPSPALVRYDWTHDQESQQTTKEDAEIKDFLVSFIQKNDLDALFFPHDSLALRILKVLQKTTIRVPDDIALMGMGDTPLSGDFGVGLSTIREPLFEIGTAAANAINDLILHPRQAPIQQLIVGNSLKIRRTT